MESCIYGTRNGVNLLKVAISGNTGRSTAPHLHITAKYGKKHIDPAILLQFVKETREEALAHLVADN